MAIKTFKRYEKKYILDKEQYELILKTINKYMELDKHCKKNKKYTIYNVYLDTKDNDIIRKSIVKTKYKEKIRIRSYNVLEDMESKAFLELKRKINGIVAKRRAILTIEEIYNLIYLKKPPKNKNYIDAQVIKEIEYFLKINKVYPMVFIRYERVAYFGKDNKNFRITFDSNIYSRRENVNLFDDSYKLKLLDDDKYLMEVKINSAMPMWLVKTLSELKLYKRSFSKYGNEYKNYLLSKNENINMGGIKNVR